MVSWKSMELEEPAMNSGDSQGRKDGVGWSLCLVQRLDDGCDMLGVKLGEDCGGDAD